ncbi:MAG: hypothetical protein EAZ53_04575 [Bacteroidetes bacterium]|nr:MAG: hypothetical protein EAZ53_04575 [Bacteroidota bacterium]
MFSCQKFEWDLKRNNPNDNMASTITGNNTTNPNIAKTPSKIEFSKFEMTSDDKGETKYLKIYLKNTGGKTSTSVKGIISTTSSYVSGLTPSTQISFNNGSFSASDDEIASNSEKYGYTSSISFYGHTTVLFKISSNTPSNSIIPFTIKISDKENNNWTENFNVTIIK